MKIDKTELKQALSILKKGASMTSGIQILSNANMTATGMTVTNLTEYVEYRVETGLTSPCTVAIPDLDGLTPIDSKDKGAWNLELLEGAPDEDGKTCNTLVASDGEETVKLDASLPVSEFPETPVLENASMYPLNVADLYEALEYVIPAISSDETRPHLNGVCFKDDLMVATNGHILHWAPSGFIIPQAMLANRTTVALIFQILKKIPAAQRKSATCHVTSASNGVFRFTCGNWTVTGVLIDSKFPPYEQIIPTHNEITTTLKHRTFEKAIKRVKKLSKAGSTLGVKITTTATSLTLESDNPERNKSCELTIPAKSTVGAGIENEAGFCVDYLITSIGWKGAEQIVIKHSECNLDPILVHVGTQYPENKVGAIVMPMRI